MKLYGSIANYNSISGAINPAGDISGALSNPLARGASAYEIAVANGYVGTEEQWLESLKGEKGDKGDPFTWNDLTAEQKKELIGPKGDKGDTGAQGPRGETGPQGPPGADGYTPVKGIDYFTKSDKTELVNAVLSALPAAEGVSY